jgi:hypothetical protein
VEYADELLQPLGFTRSGKTWNRTVGEFVDVVNLTKMPGWEGAVLFVGVAYPPVHDLCCDPPKTKHMPISACIALRDLEDYVYDDPHSPQAVAAALIAKGLPLFDQLHSLPALIAWLERPKVIGGIELIYYRIAAKALAGDRKGAKQALAEARAEWAGTSVGDTLVELKAKLGLKRW